MHRLLALAPLLALSPALAGAAELPDPKSLYKAELVAPAELEEGAEGKVVLRIKPTAEAKLKAETPFKAKLTSSGAVSLEKELGYKDRARLEDGGPVFEVPFKAVANGAGQVQADVDFYVCVAEACMKTTEKLTAPVTVK